MKKENVLKIISLILLIAVLTALTIELAPLFKNITTEVRKNWIQKQNRKHGSKGNIYYNRLNDSTNIFGNFAGGTSRTLSRNVLWPILGAYNYFNRSIY